MLIRASVARVYFHALVLQAADSSDEINEARHFSAKHHMSFGLTWVRQLASGEERQQRSNEASANNHRHWL